MTPVEQTCPKCGMRFMGSDCIGDPCPVCSGVFPTGLPDDWCIPEAMNPPRTPSAEEIAILTAERDAAIAALAEETARVSAALRILEPVAEAIKPLRVCLDYRYRTSAAGRACLDAFNALSESGEMIPAPATPEREAAIERVAKVIRWASVDDDSYTMARAILAALSESGETPR